MSVSVQMPQLGESVTEGTVTRWLKKEGERVEADEPLLEVSTDKVNTEIPSPVAGILRGITVAEDETVAVGAELAVIDETSAEGEPAAPSGETAPAAEQAAPEQPAAPAAEAQPGDGGPAGPAGQPAEQPGYPYPPVPAGQPSAFTPGGYGQPGYEQEQAGYAPPGQYQDPGQYQEPAPYQQQPAAYQQPAVYQPEAGYGQSAGYTPPPAVPPQNLGTPPAPPAAPPAPEAVPASDVWQRAPATQAPPPPPAGGPARPGSPLGSGDGPYVTPLVRKLAAEHGVDLATVSGTGVGGRIRKQDVVDAARARREAAAAAVPNGQAAVAAGAAAPDQVAGPPAGGPAPRRVIEPSSLRGKTERMSRARQLIARRMVESLQTSAQLTTVVEVDVTPIARLRDRAKADFEAREGVKLTFLPFFALATVEALKVHPRLNASIEPDGDQVTYHDAEHLGVAVDTERGLMVPVIRNAGDLNIGGLARKIADLAARTRAGQVSPDDLAGGTFTLTNTGSRGALFDTPIINQPQVGILGTGSVVRRPVVVSDAALGDEVIAVRSMAYLALSYDHRLVDGADAARFLGTVKTRLEEGAFEAELGL